jgi:hypothetical protein
MGPSEDCPTVEKNQAEHLRIGGKGRRVRRPRGRTCLLKGCGRRFRPRHPLTRYCSEQCREEARRWREWKGRHRYRQSEAGKHKRRAQSRRYRLRCKRTRAANPERRKPREGHRKKKYFGAPAIGPAAMSNSRGADARPCSDFVRTPVGEPWSGFWSENDAGGNGKKRRHRDLAEAYQRTLLAADRAEMVLRYCLSSGGVNKFGMAKQKRGRGNGAEPEVG